MVAAAALAVPLLAEAQELAMFDGLWTVADPAAARRGGGFPAEVGIDASPVTITIRNRGYGPETYLLDGARTRLVDGRTGAATLEDGALVLTFRRERTRGTGETATTIVREIYRRSGDTLTIERLARSERPGQVPTPWVAVGAVPYRLARGR